MTYPQAKCACELCAELSGLQSRFSSLYSDFLSTRIVGGSKNFVVMPSIGQLGDAHLMVVSRMHETAVANLSPDSRQELIILLSRTRSWLTTKFGGHHIVFENGDPDGFGQMSCSISHLHLHLVAYRKNGTNLARSIQKLGAEPLLTFDAISTVRVPYSLVDMPQTGMQLIRKRLPSQTLRKTIAREIGMSDWDWRQASVEDRLSDLAIVARSELAIMDDISAT